MTRDRLGRALQDLRVSVTDRCNFRCRYCMPREVFGADHVFLPEPELLTFDEIVRVVRAAVRLGVRKIRLTGGEPLMRRGLPELVARLAALRTPAGERLDLAMTTNGSLLARLAEPLAQAGLQRVTVSLDALDDATFQAMGDVRIPVARVLDGIDAAREAGLATKVNTVLQRSKNVAQVLPLARRFHGTGVTVRFIEYMDVGTTNGWRLDEVVPAAEVVGLVSHELPLAPVEPGYTGEVARRWRYLDGGGEIGVISSITEPFCATCTRLRLSADGRLFTCLFAPAGHDVKELVRAVPDDDGDATLVEHLADVWTVRTDRYSLLRTNETAGLRTRADGSPVRQEMSYLGG